MVAKAVWQIVKGNSLICGIVIESKALMCFTTLSEQGLKGAEKPSIMALMEITTISEQDTYRKN